MNGLRCLISASPLGTQPCPALQTTPDRASRLPRFSTAVFLIRGSRMSALAARLSMRLGTLRLAVIRSSLGLFPWCSVGCLMTVPVLAEKDEKKQKRGGTLIRFYQGHGVYNVAPRLGLSEQTKEGLIRYSPIACVEFWTVSTHRGLLV